MTIIIMCQYFSGPSIMQRVVSIDKTGILLYSEIMDRFAVIAGLTGIVLLGIAFLTLLSLIIRIIRRKLKFRRFVLSFLFMVILAGFSLACIYLSLFVQTFSRYTHEEKIGSIYAEATTDAMQVYYVDEQTNSEYDFQLVGDQWMVEGCILRWSETLRWLGAGSYYKVVRFRGRWERADGRETTEFEIQPQGKLWRFLLKNGASLPFIDTAFGIGAYQYPDAKTYDLSINDTGFILRKSE